MQVKSDYTSTVKHISSDCKAWTRIRKEQELFFNCIENEGGIYYENFIL